MSQPHTTARLCCCRAWCCSVRWSATWCSLGYYLVGVVRTLRWLAQETVQTPVTRETNSVLPEICVTEYMAALAAARSTRLHRSRVGVARGAVAVLGWLYHGQPEPAYSSTSAYESTPSRT
jgi:hypothetical protein